MPQRSDALTYVELTWLEKRIEHWVRFRRIAKEPVSIAASALGASLRAAPSPSFAGRRMISARSFPASTSCTQLRRRALFHPAFCPSRRRILLRIPGWPNVSRVLRAVDQVEAIGVAPANPAPDHWRHVQNRLSAGEEWRPYTTARHSAPLLRRSDAR